MQRVRFVLRAPCACWATCCLSFDTHESLVPTCLESIGRCGMAVVRKRRKLVPVMAPVSCCTVPCNWIVGQRFATRMSHWGLRCVLWASRTLVSPCVMIVTWYQTTRQYLTVLVTVDNCTTWWRRVIKRTKTRLTDECLEEVCMRIATAVSFVLFFNTERLLS
jgi:hypothetical protein